MTKLLSTFAVCVLLVYGFSARAGDAKTFKTDDEGFIRNWLVLEPIQLDDKAGNHDEDNQKDFFAKEFFAGMKKCKPKEGEKVKVDNKDLTWKAVQVDDFKVEPEAQDPSAVEDRLSERLATLQRESKQTTSVQPIVVATPGIGLPGSAGTGLAAIGGVGVGAGSGPGGLTRGGGGGGRTVPPYRRAKADKH